MNDQIQYINIAVTNRCNLSCRQCSIWQEKPKKDISQEAIGKIIESRMLADNVDIAITGGEPFLHKELKKLIGLILQRRPDCLKSFSTNGTKKDEMVELFNGGNVLSPEFALYVSFDGISKHNQQRGESSEKVLNNLKIINKIFPSINICLKFTITRINYGDIMPTYEYARLNGFQFRPKLVENAINYTNKISAENNMSSFNVKEKKKIASDLLRIYRDLKNKNRREVVFIMETVNFLLGKNKPVMCQTPSNRIFVMPDGEVYSCIHFNNIGNLNDNSLEEVWNSKEAELIRDKVKKNGCSDCASYHGFSFS